MSIISYFCMTGGHSVNVEAEPTEDLSKKLPEGWTLRRASCINAPRGPEDPWSPGIWYADENSGASILSCPEHPLIEI